MTRAFLILDLTHDVANREGRFGKLHGTAEHAHSREVPAKLVAAADAARAAGDRIVWVFPSDELFTSNGYPASDEWGGAVDEEYGRPLPSELVIWKTDIDAFVDTPLGDALRASDVDEVVLAGIATTHVVSATARGAVARGYRTVVAADGCADHSEADHRAALSNLPPEVVVTELAEIWGS